MNGIAALSRSNVIGTMRARLALVITLFMTISLPVRAAELIMFEQAGCPWCERWNTEIAPIYPKTAEGKIAPLRRVDIFDPMPQDLSNIQPESFTPSFVLVNNGQEVGRIRGYAGETFFWWMLGELFEKLEKERQSGFDNSVNCVQEESVKACRAHYEE